MGYGVMVLHDAENYNKIMAPCDHGALANGSIQYNHGALKLGAVQKDQIVKKLQIRFILYSSLRKGSVSVTLTGCSLQLTNAAGGAWTQTSPGGPVADLRVCPVCHGIPGLSSFFVYLVPLRSIAVHIRSLASAFSMYAGQADGSP
jgi:hypothetical protein